MIFDRVIEKDIFEKKYRYKIVEFKTEESEILKNFKKKNGELHFCKSANKK